jgi:predicted nucleotidyltransferase
MSQAQRPRTRRRRMTKDKRPNNGLKFFLLEPCLRSIELVHMQSTFDIPLFIQEQQETIHRLCQKLSVSELCIFGSALREDFDLQKSDLDFLVEFENPDAPGISDRYFALADGLEKIFQRRVDLVTKQSIKNRIFRETVNATSQTLYAA